MIDTTQGSPGWWLIRLAQRLRADLPRMNLLQNYYIGQHPLPRGERTRARLYRDFQRRARSNYTGLVVESVAERLHVDGFRAGGSGTDAMDTAAWQIWQANHLDSDSGMVHQQALTMGRSYVIIGAPAEPGGLPVITAEDPRQVAHEASPTNRRELVAALKIYLDDVAAQWCAVVYLPDVIAYFTAPAPAAKNIPSWQSSQIQAQQWFPDETVEVVDDELPAGMIPNPIGIVPVVGFYNRPMTNLGGISVLGEFEDVIDIQDRINGIILDRLVITRMQAYRQRYMTGVDIETDEAGTPKRPFDPDVESLWVGVDEATKFGDFAETDITPILTATTGDVTHLAAITRTPPQYLLGQLANLSGDALEAAQAGLVSKIQERMIHFGESWEQVIRVASMWSGDTPTPEDAEVVWADPTQRGLADLANAAVALQTAGVPWRSRMTALGYSPSDITRMEAELEQDALRARTMTSPPDQVTLTETEAILPPGAPEMAPQPPAPAALPPGPAREPEPVGA